MPGPWPGRCPACDGPKNSYHPLCSACERIDEDHIITADGNIAHFPQGKSEHHASRMTSILEEFHKHEQH